MARVHCTDDCSPCKATDSVHNSSTNSGTLLRASSCDHPEPLGNPRKTTSSIYFNNAVIMSFAVVCICGLYYRLHSSNNATYYAPRGLLPSQMNINSPLRLRRDVAGWETDVPEGMPVTVDLYPTRQITQTDQPPMLSDMRFLDLRDKHWACCVSITRIENGCRPCLDLPSIRVQVPTAYDYTSPIKGTHLSTLGNAKLKEVLGNWIGNDRVEARNALFVSVGNKANCSRSQAETTNWDTVEPFMENACWKRLSNEAAYADKRGLVMADVRYML